MTGRSRWRAWIARLVTPPVAVVAAFLMAGTALAAPAWTWLQPPIAAGASNGVLGGVSCPSAGACVAVGTSIGPKGDAAGAFTDAWNGTSWTLESVPRPAVTTLSGVSCRSATWCIAVGYVPNSADPGANVPLALRWNGVRWSALAVPMPAGDTTATGAVASRASPARTRDLRIIDTTPAVRQAPLGCHRDPTPRHRWRLGGRTALVGCAAAFLSFVASPLQIDGTIVPYLYRPTSHPAAGDAGLGAGDSLGRS